MVINGAPLDPARSYRVGTFSFLATGGDNFRVFTEGSNTKDSGLIDRDAWITYLGEKSPRPRLHRTSPAAAWTWSMHPATVNGGAEGHAAAEQAGPDLAGQPENTSSAELTMPSGSGGGTGFAVLGAAVLPSTLGTFPSGGRRH